MIISISNDAKTRSPRWKLQVVDTLKQRWTTMPLLRPKRGRRRSDRLSWLTPVSHRSVGRLHTRLSHVLADDRIDALNPNSKASKFWSQLLLLCVIQEAFLLPFALTFQSHTTQLVSVLVLICEAIFALDLFVQANMGFYEHGNLIRDRSCTRRKYLLSKQFVLDVVALVPSQFFGLENPQLLAKWQLFKLLRCGRVPRLMAVVDELYTQYFVGLKLFKVLLATLYLAHVLACVRFSFGEDEQGTDPWLITPTWNHHSVLDHYFVSLFWSVGIMTGLFEGDVPRHSAEFVFTITVALCGFAMFTTLCGTIFVISKCESGNTEEVEARINQLVHVLSFHHVPEKQQTQAVEYLKRYYADAVETDRENAKLLCPSISHDIQAERLRPIIATVELFNGCSDQFITAVTNLLELVAVPAHTKLFSRGNHGDAMYVAHSGVIAVVLKSVVVREIRKGSCFGELYAFSSLRCPTTIISWTYATLYKLSRFHCERVIEAYPGYASVIANNIKESLGQLKDNKKRADTTSVRPTSLDNFAKEMPRQHSAPSRETLSSAFLRKGSLPWLPRKSVVIPMENDFQYPQHEQDNNDPGSGGTEPHNAVTFTRAKHPSTKLSPSGGSYSMRSKTSITPEHIRKLSGLIVHKSNGLFGTKLFTTCIDHRSVVRKRWLLLMIFNLFYCWLTVPVQVIFPLWQRPSWIMLVADGISNAGFLVDIALNFNLSYMVDSELVVDPKRTARRYFGDIFFFDLMCVFPCEYLDTSNYGLLRIPRLLCLYHLRKQLCEIKVFITFNSRRQLWLFGVLLFMLCHVTTCIHFGISYHEGYDTNEDTPWILPRSLCLRRLNSTHLEDCNGQIFDEETDRSLLRSISVLGYFRSLYYAVGVFTSPGKSVEPTSQAQLIVGVVLMLAGFFISAIVVDNVQKRFTASALEQKQFFETRNRIQLFLRRQNAPLLIHHRVKSFLDYWWSSHRGAVVGDLLADLPRTLRLELLLSICLPVLQTLGLLQGVHPVRDKLEQVLVENAEFILYGQGETIYHHGDYASGIFFLLEGEVRMVRERGLPFEIPRGSFFGAAALTEQERGDGYTEHTSAISGCTLLFISRDQIQALETVFPAFRAEFISLEQRILGNKWQSKHMSKSVESQAPVAISSGLKRFLNFVYDPDSFFVLAWETWIFFMMSIQWILVVFVASFSLSNGHGYTDVLMVFLEISFVVDICIRPRLGFYEYGNKIMSIRRIRREYLHSRAFALDIAAVLPLYIVNWNVPAHQRWELLNMNKLLRLFKVPRQLHALETRYLKHSTELHLFKLLYYTFMLSHVLGCIWFNFASKMAVPNFSSSEKSTVFGGNPWLPSKKLGEGSETLQYMASLYWSFGLMSSSGESELPRTTPECVFSIFTMASGFFLFAYVIGNFTDIIDLSSSETRDFKLKMSAVRQMLDYFTMPRALQERVKTFLMFKRYHTITQEKLLVDSLPPSLVTDIRLVYLKPMIEKVEFLAGMEVSITRMLVSQFAQLLVPRGEFVMKLGESGSDMFFIYAGILEILLPASKPTPMSNASGKDIDTGAEPGLAGPMELDIVGDNKAPLTFSDQLKQVGTLSDGKYFGENGLFTNSKRDAFVQAQTSCILYSLSRESLELVFEKYPSWKRKVLRVANIHKEQARLSLLSRKERRNGMQVATDSELSPSEIVNERGEAFKDRRSLRDGNSKDSNQVLSPLLKPWRALVNGVAVQSTFHLLWLRFMVFCIAYVTIMIPYQLTMDSMDRSSVVLIICKVLELLCELAFAMDIWFNWHIQEAQISMELYDENLRCIYKKERMIWDIIAAFPFYDLLSLFKCSPWFKLLRCIKIVNIGTYVKELNRRHVSNEIMLFWYVWMGYLLVIYWIACAYLAVATEAGFATQWKSWLPTKELEISDPQNPLPNQLIRRLLRAVFFAITAFVKKTYIPAPETAPLYAFHITVSFIGLMLMSIVIGELASLFVSYIGLEVGFRKNHIAVELYLTRLGVSKELRTRSYAFMKSFWSAHAGVNYEELLSEMPRDIRVACVLHVSRQPLKWFVSKALSPVCWDGDKTIDSLTLDIAEQLRFESYPRDENVVTEGSFIRAMYFVLKGHLTMESSSLRHRPVGLRGGSYFGERGLLGCTISAYNVRTVRACDLLSISSEAFSQVLQKHPFSRLAFHLCDTAYRYLKAQRLESCSKNDLAGHWGTAILLNLQNIQRKSQEDLDVTQLSAEAGAALTSVDAFASNLVNADISLDKSQVVTRKPSFKDGGTTSAKEKEFGELPTHLDEMVEVLNSASSCFEAFEPILHIVMATDPLDWNASFGSKPVL
ncbi:Cyclic nucleotide-gated cation channel alpha-3 [Phytophthora citrophthora]|uniref:Cyclic nucleotide-gated cation channel alpha-3 n=1 Tax=Phytophthora citrophthora TaxID=4793 RepID=A0AAD9GR04_9STRA|nr:Cyclic nucleotide-gated cation channel alpha-3 [Phytophthora citrophthora]